MGPRPTLPVTFGLRTGLSICRMVKAHRRALPVRCALIAGMGRDFRAGPGESVQDEPKGNVGL